MHLIEMLALRAVPAAGVSIGVTRRCPLSCAHCSTSSMPRSEQLPASILKLFVDTFSPDAHPHFMAMSGGEALLRPELVRSLACRARQSGTRSSVLSGLFFARNGRIPKPIQAAVDAVDHFSVSMDVFHEREVPRHHVFSILSILLDQGKHLSMHIAGLQEADPYVDQLVLQVRSRFGDRIPMLVNTLSAFGRAREFIVRLASGSESCNTAEPNPCTMAAWPVVSFDGVVAACGNDNLIGRVPEHLKIGDIRTDSWADIHARCTQGHMPKALRTYGPEYLRARFGASPAARLKSCSGYCDTCINLRHDHVLQENVRIHFNKESTHSLSNSVTQLQLEMGAVGFAKRYSHPRYAELVLLGAS